MTLDKVFLNNLKIGVSVLLKQKIAAEPKPADESAKEKTDKQAAALRQVSDLVAQMTELTQTTLQGAKPEIESLAEKIMEDLTQLNSLMQKTVVEHTQND